MQCCLWLGLSPTSGAVTKEYEAMISGTKSKQYEKILPQFHFVHPKSHMLIWELACAPQWEVSFKCLNPGMPFMKLKLKLFILK
jgi:hypothetical protein